MLGYDATQDMARHNPDVHYRVYFCKPQGQFNGVCLQNFDYYSLDDRCFVDYAEYVTQAEADAAALRLRVATWLVMRSLLATTGWL